MTNTWVNKPIDTTNYFNSISCHAFDIESIPIIEKKLALMKSTYIEKYLQDILKILRNDIENENTHFLSMVDCYLFDLHKMPILCIHNSHAQKNKCKNNITMNYSRKCNLTTKESNCLFM